MIKVTSKIGSHKRGQSFAIVRPDSCGVSHSESVPSLSSASSGLGQPGVEPGFSTARKQFDMPGPGLAGSGSGPPGRFAGVEKDGGAEEVVLLKRWWWLWPRIPSRAGSLPLQRLWALTGVWCVSTDVIARRQ